MVESTDTNLSPEPIATSPGEADPELRLSSCMGILSLNYLPAAVADVHPPGSWQGSPLPAIRVRMEWHLCERISIGPFERGPISFVLETHDNREAPSKCMEGEFTTTEILNAMWIDDPAVANFLKNELDLPIGVSSAIVRDDGPIEGLETWSVEIGGHRSWLVNPTPISNPTFTLHDVYRYYWQHAEGIGIMDFTSDTVSPSYDSPFSFGEVSPPFVASVLGSPAYTGYGGIFSDTSSSSKFELFGDFECEDPL